MEGVGGVSANIQDRVAVSVLKKAMEQQAAPLQVMEKTLEKMQPADQASKPPASPNQNVGKLVDMYG